MKFLFDFFPVLLFFIAFKLYGIYAATAVAIAASIGQVSWVWLRRRKVEKMHLVSLGLIVVFGGATLIFHDKTFIQWKPTVLNWLFALVFLASQFIGDKPVAQRMMEHAVQAETHIWRRLNISWVLFFIAMGGANLYVAYTYDEETWVNFKLFGMMGLTFLFVIAQAFFLARHIEVPETPQEE